MDGLSVIASVTGILTAAAKVIMMVTQFIEKERDAPHSMRKVLAEVADLSNCLTQLSPFIQNIENVPTERKAAISVEQVVAINTSCVLTLSELERVLDSFHVDQPMAAGTRLRWARHQEKIENILVRVRASKSSLNLILTIFTCTSVSEIQSSISNLNTTVQSILANSEDIPRRIASMEMKIAGLSRHATSTIERPTDTSDGASTIHPTNYSIEHDHSSPSDDGHAISQFCIQIQAELEASRVYRRTAQRHSISSFPSGFHSAAWSALSGVSLAEISNLSVLSLPISYNELWNPKHYTIAHEIDTQVTMRPQINIILLGAKGSGKSTILKQMNLRWSGSLCDVDEQKRTRQVIFGKMVLKQWPLPLCYDLDNDIQNFDRYLSKAYSLSDADILHCNIPTFETIEMSTRIGDLQYHVFDVGSGSGERGKAIYRFATASGSHCMIYTVPLNCKVRILDSLEEFAFDCLHMNFKGAPMILLFTHIDLFKSKIRKNADANFAAKEIIAQMFRNARNGVTISRIFFANATDTKEFSAVLSEIEDLMKAQIQEEQLYVAKSDDK